MRKIFSGIGSFLQTPVGVILTTNVIWNIVVWAAKIPFSYIVSGIVLALDIFAAFYLRDKLIYFFSQFVLPIQNPKHRREIAARVSNFESGSRGPALFVKNGRVILHEGETGKRGAGVTAPQPEDIAPLLQQALAANAVTLLHVPISGGNPNLA